jgi:lipoprotein-releasing system permease protein
MLVGCNPLEQQKVTTIGEYVIHGDFDDLALGGNKIAIGDELAKELGTSLYQNVHVSLAKGERAPFKVAAIFKTGIKQMDSTAFGSIGDVQKINLTPNQVNEITVRLYDYTQSASIASSWSGMSIEKVESWDQQNANIFNVFKIQDAIRFLSVGSVLIVAGFGIYNVLNMTVVQKRKDIAILRSMGYNTYEVVSLFFSQGLLLGIVGAFFGLIFGYCLCLYLETIPFAGGPIGAGAGHLIISFNPKIYIQAVILALTSTSIASILPARAAGRLTPLEIIRAGAE